MALISRVSRLLRADLHAVLDHLEEPEVLLRQAVREMEEAITGDVARLRRLRHEHEHLEGRTRDLQQTLDNIDSELDVCFAAAEHELARSLCRRKLETEQLLQALGRRCEMTRRDLEALEERCRDQQLRFDAMRQKADLFSTEVAQAAEDAEPHPLSQVCGDAVEVTFLREQQKRRASGELS